MVAAVGRPIAEVPIVWEDHPESTVATLPTALALGRTLVLARHRAKLRAGDPLHVAVDRFVSGRPALVERLGGRP